MNKKLFSLSIFAVALAMAFVFSAPIVTMAASDNYNDQFVGITNLLGVDEAHYGIGARDRDRAPVVNFQTYGLQGDWAGQH